MPEATLSYPPVIALAEQTKMASGNNENFPTALRDYVICNITTSNQIGKGANGRILEAKWEGTIVAVKQIHSILNDCDDGDFQFFKRSFLCECEQSIRLRHPNVVRFFGIYHTPGARVPSLVMERLHCSLTNLLEDNQDVPIETKISIIKDVALGLRYLHTRNPPIIHRDLSSNNVLLSKGMEGKIGDLGTARLVDPRRQSRMSQAPGTVHFMPPEVLEDVHFGKELDVFSFGCVMLHTLSHQWPTPSQAVIINPDTGLVTGGRSEVERRSQYFERIDRSRSDVLIPLIESCLGNLPKNRPSIVRVCDQLEGELADRNSNEFTILALQQEIQQKNAEIQRKQAEIQKRDTEIDTEIQRYYGEIQRKNHEIQELKIQMQRNHERIHRLTTEVHDKDTELQIQNAKLQKKDAEIHLLTSTAESHDGEIQKYQDKDLLAKKKEEIQYLNTVIHDKNIELKQLRDDMYKQQSIPYRLLPKKVSNSSN